MNAQFAVSHPLIRTDANSVNLSFQMSRVHFQTSFQRLHCHHVVCTRLLDSYIESSELICSTNPFHHRLFWNSQIGLSSRRFDSAIIEERLYFNCVCLFVGVSDCPLDYHYTNSYPTGSASCQTIGCRQPSFSGCRPPDLERPAGGCDVC